MFTTNLKIKTLAIAVFLLCLCSCSLTSRSGQTDQFQVEVQNAPRASIDPEIQKRSVAIHSYLVGQIAYDQEDYEKAFEYFERANESEEIPSATVSTKLAELHLRSGDLESALVHMEKALSGQPEDLHLHLTYGGVLESLGRDEEAEKVYSSLISSNPELVDAYVILSSLYIKQSKYDRSIEVLEKLIEREPNKSISHYYLGRAYEASSDLGRAEKHLRKAHSMDSGSLDIGVDLVRVLLKRGRIEEAQLICFKVLEENPDNLVLRRILGQLLIGSSKFDEALEQLDVLETLEEDSTETRFKIALIRIQQQQLKEAERDLNLVLARDPDHAEARYYLATIFASTGQRQKAISEFLQIPADEENFVRSRTFAAFMLRQDGELERAEDIMREALEEDNLSNREKIFSYLILILRDSKKFEEAAVLLKEGVEREPTNDQLWFNYAVILYDLGRESESYTAMNQVLTINPEHSDALNFWAYSIAEKDGDLKEALVLIERALLIRPKDGFYLDTKGWIQFKMEDYQVAVETLEGAVELTGFDLVIMEHYGDALVEVGRYENAIDIYRDALERSDAPENDDQLRSLERVKKKLDLLLGAHPEFAGQVQSSGQ